MRLSICIPTYNRAVELDRLMDSIAKQVGHNLIIEVAISDNASTDNTPDIVGRHQLGGIPIVYQRLDQNHGFDYNLVNAVSISSGDYCWLVGSDDMIEPNAFSKLEKVLEKNTDISGISVGLQAYNTDLSQRVDDSNQIMNYFERMTILHGRDTIISTLCTLLGFISSLVVRRDLWMNAATQAPLESYFKGYIHLYLVAKMLDDTSRWVCLPERLAGYRTGNDSFKASDEFARTRLDIVGYDLAFGDTLGRDNPAYKQAMAKVAVSCIAPFFLSAKLQGVSLAYWRQAIPTSISYYWRYPDFWLRTFPIALIPGPVLSTARFVYRRAVKPLHNRF